MKGHTCVFLSVCLILLFAACGDRPSNVLSEDKMVDLMVDMELSEAYANSSPGMSVNKVELGRRVLKAHGVSEETLDTTLAWYGRNVDEYAKLFEKIDKKIQKKSRKYTEIPGIKPVQSENLWPYSEHLVLSPLGGTDYFSFSFPAQNLKKGEVLELSFSMPNPSGFKSTFGVEYTDGHGEGVVSNISGKNSVKISLSTDTLRNVGRIFGMLHFNDTKSQPLYLDSLKLIVQPFDSLNYKSSRRSQLKFGPMVKKAPEKKVEKKDTVTEKTDTLTKDPIKKDSPEVKPDSAAKQSVSPVKQSVSPVAQSVQPVKQFVKQ